jgi:hypothetical protein
VPKNHIPPDTPPKQQIPPVPLETVLKQEREEIEEIRKNRGTYDKDKHGVRRHTAHAPDTIAGAGSAAKPAWQTDDENKDWVEAVKEAHNANLVGLAFSGGGIRSATFNLGVLQALAELNLLQRVDYLSTVSGGGYIGGWLAAWSKRLGSFLKVQECLATNRVNQEDDKEPTPIRFLRVFSNYLTPKVGIFSGDTWAMVAIYLRNMLLNQVVVFAMVAAALLAPRLAVRLGDWARYLKWEGIGLAGFLMLLAFVMITNNMEYLDHRDRSAERELTKPGWILALVAVPLFFDAVLGALFLNFHASPSKWCAVAVGAIGYGVIWVLASVLAWIYENWLGPKVKQGTEKVATAWGVARTRIYEKWLGPVVKAPAKKIAPNKDVAKTPEPEPRKTSPFEYGITLVSAIVSGALAGLLYALLWEHAFRWKVDTLLTVGAPLVLGIFLLAGTLHIGLMGIVFSDRRREWWGRLGGCLLLWGLAWMVVFWVALSFPDFMHHQIPWIKTLVAKYLTPTWIATTAAGVLAGKSTASGKQGAQSWKDVLAKIAPYVFVAGLLCWVSYGIWVVQRLKIWSEYEQSPSGVWDSIHARWVSSPPIGHPGIVHWLLVCISTHRPQLSFAACVALAAIMAWRVDINQFSMHCFYRNRLVKCYLGASNKDRSPNRFTGFDASDDIPLKDLTTKPENGKPYDGPYPVLNASLNLVKGKDLAWQERKAESFVMTPKFCGYDVWLEEQDSPMVAGTRPLEEAHAQGKKHKLEPRLERYGYRPTADYAFPPPEGQGYFLGTAMGISGAAASPNMGFYTSMPTAFLMTVFNVRLGQWSGNTRNRRTWMRSSPRMGLSYLLNELLGGTDDEAAYVYLSDGGHFENMALYELVKRRCGLIILCDAEADDCYGFSGLGGAVRKCRIDLGIDIDLDVTGIAPKKAGKPSKVHCAVGTIHYETVDMHAPTGTIIYFKASLTSDESADIKNYSKIHGTFPHESTVDQWFSESQFESYRELGYHEVMSSMQGEAPSGEPHTATANPADKKKKPSDLATVHKQLKDALTPFGFETSKLKPRGKNAG